MGHLFPALGNQQGEEGQAESRAKEKRMGTEGGLSWRLALISVRRWRGRWAVQREVMRCHEDLGCAVISQHSPVCLLGVP